LAFLIEKMWRLSPRCTYPTTSIVFAGILPQSHSISKHKRCISEVKTSVSPCSLSFGFIPSQLHKDNYLPVLKKQQEETEYVSVPGRLSSTNHAADSPNADEFDSKSHHL
jgi:hypothetical protein